MLTLCFESHLGNITNTIATLRAWPVSTIQKNNYNLLLLNITLNYFLRTEVIRLVGQDLTHLLSYGHVA
nr:MAG TPA: hypothetical protein [Caudoviricetes sp.]